MNQNVARHSLHKSRVGVSTRNDTDYGSFLVRSEYVGFVELGFLTTSTL